MSREDLFLILTRRDASPLRTKLGPVYSHFCLTSLKAPVCVCQCLREYVYLSHSFCIPRHRVTHSVAHLTCLLRCFFFSSHLPFHTFFFSSFFFCVFLFSPIARVNLFATGSIARFLRLWTSCDQNFAFLSVRDVGIVLEK